MQKISTTSLALAVGAILLTWSATSTQAAPITYGGDLTGGTLFTGGPANPSDHISPSLWNVGNLWTLSVNAGDVVTVTARRLSDFDPIMGIWNGLESDTTAYTYYDLNSTNTQSIGVWDDNLPNTFGGTAGYGDPQATFTAALTGIYTVGIFGLGGTANNQIYSIQATGATGDPYISAVPLPPSAILFGTALLGIAGLRRRKRKASPQGNLMS